MSTFDPTTFLNATTDEALDTVIIPCPVGDYQAIAEKVDVKQWSTKDGASSGLKIEIFWDIQDENAKQVAGRDPLRVRQQQMLDLTDTGQLDLGKGKNVGLGRIREALGLNSPGEPFAIGMIQGRMALVTVSHRAGDDGVTVYDEIKKVAKA
jgi:hypothetical protein